MTPSLPASSPSIPATSTAFGTAFVCPPDEPCGQTRPQVPAAPPRRPLPYVPHKRSNACAKRGFSKLALSLQALSIRYKLYRQWDRWAKSGPPGENRATAVARMKEWVGKRGRQERLVLEELGLSSLPEGLPEGIQSVWLLYNPFKHFPSDLPSSLLNLYMAHCHMEEMPQHLPPMLQQLHLTNNRLKTLPDNLPASLTELTLAENQLTRLPDSLPASLTKLTLTDNRLQCLPDELPAGLAELNLAGNLLERLPESLPAGLKELTLTGNHLRCLPTSLPAGLSALWLRDNRLERLPDELPDSLKILVVDQNRLSSLPDTLPAGLTTLYANGNSLSSLPSGLPEKLKFLSVAGNGLASLPATLPESLVSLTVRNNQLTAIPNAILRLSPSSFVYLEQNPLPLRLLDQLAAIVQASDYAGPRIYFSMESGEPHIFIPPLAETVAAWQKDCSESELTVWRACENEPGAKPFAAFLERLRHTVNAADPNFRKRIVAWLEVLAARNTLRGETFLAAAGATQSCEDRVSLALNDMKKLWLASDAETGAYDHRIDELITLARGMFRLDKLEQIARVKASQLRLVDDIEVYLAYQVKLREPLELPIDTADMRFFQWSYLTPSDLSNALASVRQAEQEKFSDYLSMRWAPWQALLERQEPALVQQSRSDTCKAMEEPFEQRLASRLAEFGLNQDADARRLIGARVKDELAGEISRQVTEAFLARRGLSHLLDPRPASVSGSDAAV